jgi:hypothetical protein
MDFGYHKVVDSGYFINIARLLIRTTNFLFKQKIRSSFYDGVLQQLLRFVATPLTGSLKVEWRFI